MAGGGMGGGSSGGASSGMNSAPSQPAMSNMQFNPYASGGMRSNPYGGYGGFQGGFGRPMGGPFGGSFQRGFGGFQGGNQFGGFQRGMGGPMNMAMPYQQPSQSYLSNMAMPNMERPRAEFAVMPYQQPSQSYLEQPYLEQPPQQTPAQQSSQGFGQASQLPPGMASGLAALLGGFR